jgi:hypothetical protein
MNEKLQLLDQLEKDLAYVNAIRDAHVHIQSIIDEHRKRIIAEVRTVSAQTPEEDESIKE